MNYSFRIIGICLCTVINGIMLMAAETDGLSMLRALSYDGTGKSLQHIQEAVTPYVEADNAVALSISRQTMYGLGQDIALGTIPKPTEITMSASQRQQSDAWAAAVQEKADNGDLFFKTVVGILCFDGIGVEKDDAKCLSLWKEAAAAGYPDANCKLGNVYWYGLMHRDAGDRKTGLEYFTKASELGSAMASFKLGCIYNEGKLGRRDDSQAFQFWLKAAQKGHAVAQRNVGGCYVKSKGVKQDMAAAKEWLFKAAEAGDKGAHSWLTRHFASDFNKWQAKKLAPKSISTHINMEADDPDEDSSRDATAVMPKSPAEPMNREGPVHSH
jgi:hypothetical protein